MWPVDSTGESLLTERIYNVFNILFHLTIANIQNLHTNDNIWETQDQTEAL